MSEPTTIKIPSWAGKIGWYIIGLLPIILSGYLAFHDLQRDFAAEQTKAVKLEARVVVLEAVKHERDISLVELRAELKKIGETMTRVEESLLRLAGAE